MRRTCTAIATSAQRNARIVLKDIAFIPKDEITQAIDLLIIAQARRLNMGETIEAEIISRRRAFWILGAGMAFGMGMPAAVLTASDAQAQTPGMERRQDRTERRQERRTDRTERRETRREGRAERRDVRRTGTPATSSPATGTTGQAPPRQ